MVPLHTMDYYRQQTCLSFAPEVIKQTTQKVKMSSFQGYKQTCSLLQRVKTAQGITTWHKQLTDFSIILLQV